MVDFINLRQVRKQKQRLEKQRRAEQNRLRFGQSKASKSAAEAERKRSDAHWTGKKLDSDTGGDAPRSDVDS